MGKYKLDISNDFFEVRRVHAFIIKFGEQFRIERKLLDSIRLCVEELVVNTILYGYKDGRKGGIEIVFSIENDLLEVVIKDDGIQFDPLSIPERSIDSLSVEDLPDKGYGLSLVRKMVDSITYNFRDGRNITRIEKTLKCS